MPFDFPDFETYIATLTDDAGGGADDGTPIDKAFLTVVRQKLEQGGMLPRASKTTTYTASATTDAVILCSTAGGAWSLTLPAVESGLFFLVAKTTGDANVLTIDGNASETINGATTLALSSQYDAVLIVSDGSAWYTVAKPGGGGLVPIATAASSSGEFNLASLTTTSYDVLEVEISGGESDTDDVEIHMQLNGATGTVYRTALEGKNDASAAFALNDMGAAHAFICGSSGAGDSVGNAADEGFHALVRIYNDFSANECFYTVSSVWESSYSQTFAAYGGGKADLGSDTSITAIKIKPQSGNIDSGNIYLKGRVKS